MSGEKFSLLQYSIQAILGLIEAKMFVVPEIQRPFVWKRSQVRDLIDSLYNGYPTGYIIIWKNPDVHTKDGKISAGKKVLIDGQQRVTALMAAIAGQEVLDVNFNKGHIKIAFNPLATEEDKRFAVQDASHLKDKKWIPDISKIFKPEFNSFNFAIKYSEDNPEIQPNEVSDIIIKLKEIANRQIGVIELDQALDIDEVTEIFIRINSKGTPLSQSDFVMSKMASDATVEAGGHNGCLMRKAVDYFCHLAVKPDFYSQMVKDAEFQKTKYAEKLRWLENDYDDIYDPDFNDMLRVSFMHQFGRGKLSDLVSLLSGRDFVTKEYREDIIADSYRKLDQGIMNFMTEYDFKQFVGAIKGAGFRSSKLLTSQTTLNVAYTLYLMLKKEPGISNEQIKRAVQKWFVMATLTGRYTGSAETIMSYDIRNINEKGFNTFFNEVESSVLSDTFWNITLPQNLETNSVNSPAFNTFIAAQIHLNCNSLLMTGMKIQDLVSDTGDIHHTFPKAYLKKEGYKNKRQYNQVANYVYLDTQVNKNIGENAPANYFGTVIKQCHGDKIEIGNISDMDVFKKNLEENCLPEEVINMTAKDYESFLAQRRTLMAKLIERYYKGL